MSVVKSLLDSLLWDIYGKQQDQERDLTQQQQQKQEYETKHKQQYHVSTGSGHVAQFNNGVSKYNDWNVNEMQQLKVRKLIDYCAILKLEVRLMSSILERVLIQRDRHQRHQKVLCGFVDAILHVICDDVRPKMRFSLMPPQPKYTFVQDVIESSTIQDQKITINPVPLTNQNDYSTFRNMNFKKEGQQNENDINGAREGNDEEISDYIQWLHAMKLVARLPGGIPPEFRRKLWLSLADKYLKSKNINWGLEETKCFCDKWREDDEELGVQIVKDLHRTGSTLCTGPTGDINQAKLKRILLGYARYNPDVGYCQGFNMLGALILQVMDKQESESIKVMIYLVEGILPTGYFCGSMGGLQADMAVFRELMQIKLPRLAKHLQKLQGPNGNAYEPPLTNVFTMQWFLTMFCTCLPMNCVLRVWDLVLIEGSDVLLRTALVLWSLLEERVLKCYSADDFYGKMGSFSNELLNGRLIDPNGLIENIVQLGPISNIQNLREKHLYNITPIKHKSGIRLYYDGEDTDIDEDSQLAVATVWGLPWGRRSSTTPATNKQLAENKERLALDISLLKKQYDRLRERQKQAHIILTTACSTAYQTTTPSLPNTSLPVNQLLLGCTAIVTNKGRRAGPARKPSLPAILPIRHSLLWQNRLKRGETMHDYDTNINIRQRSRDSLTWKEIKAERTALLSSESVDNLQSQKLRTRGSGKSDSSSYSEESEEDEVDSNTDTSLCDEDEMENSKDIDKNKTNLNSSRVQARKKAKCVGSTIQKRTLHENDNNTQGNNRPKSWASSEIPFVLMTTDSPIHNDNESGDVNLEHNKLYKELEVDNLQECKYDRDKTTFCQTSIYGYSKMDKLSPVLDEKTINNMIRPPVLGHSTDSENNETKSYDVSDEGVTNEYFERTNSLKRPIKLDLIHSLQYEMNTRDAYTDKESHNSRLSSTFSINELNAEEDFTSSKILLHKDYSQDSSEENIPKTKSASTSNVIDESVSNYCLTTSTSSTHNKKIVNRTQKDKRKDPRRLTRSYTIYADDQQYFQKNDCTSVDKDLKLSSKELPYNTNILQENSNKAEKNQQREVVPPNLNLIKNYRSLEEHTTNLSISPRKENVNFKNTNYNNKEKQSINNDGINKKIEKSERIKETNLITNTENSENVNKTTDTPIQRLKKIPSTAELEIRFSALERHNVAPQRSYSESKKKPPDGIDEIKITSKSNLEAEIHTEHDEKKHESIMSKKVPPTTEELERRFQTLENELSGTKSRNELNEKYKCENSNFLQKPNQNESDSRKSNTPKEIKQIDVKLVESTIKTAIDSKKTFEKNHNSINQSIINDSEKLVQEEVKSKIKKQNENTASDNQNFDNIQEEPKGLIEKCKFVNHILGNQSNEPDDNELFSLKKNVQQKPLTQKRRSSEPPTTEELERRYESLKRRLSSKVMEVPQTLEKETTQDVNVNDSSTIADKSSQLSKVKDFSIKTKRQLENEIFKNNHTSTNSKSSPNTGVSKISDTKVQVVAKDHSKIPPLSKKIVIPTAPTPPQLYDNANNYDLLQVQHIALIEELQSKIKTPENGENIKPSTINRKRTKAAQRSPYKNNKTSEAHAISAFCRMEKCEPWSIYNRKIIRRFSDLPSRADLENRLQFLEEQLNRKIHKQDITSDSEVLLKNKRLEKIPTISQSQCYAGHVNLEMRVQALEKQLSENSLKLLEAMDASALIPKEISDDNLIVPRTISTDTIDITGKELVKYRHAGKLNELETHQPINISINIKMSLENPENKDKLIENNEQVLPPSQELEKRFQTLEQHVIDSTKLPEINAKSDKSVKEDKSRLQISGENIPILVKTQKSETIDVNENTMDSNQIEDNKEIVLKPISNVEHTEKPCKEINISNKKGILQSNEENVEQCLNVQKLDKTHKKEDLDHTQQVHNVAQLNTLKKVDEKPDEIEGDVKREGKPVRDAENSEIADSNKKTLVLLLDNQPKSVKVRRLTRANTEELEGLFQALEKQLNERNLIKAPDGSLRHAEDVIQTQDSNNNQTTSQAEAIAKLSQEITEYTKSAEEEHLEKEKSNEDEPYDWGKNPVKHHLKRKTVHLPSTKELEARFRSLERQIKLLEDVEKIDVEQRLKEIERKIQLQYSLSHEKDINRFLQLCEGKHLTEINSDATMTKSSLISPCHKFSQDKKTQTPTRTVVFKQDNYNNIPSTGDLEYRFRSLDLNSPKKVREMSNKERQSNESIKMQRIHPLEMLLEPSPDDSVIPTTGELEHRLRILEEKKTPISPTPSRSKSRSPISKHVNQKISSTYTTYDAHSPPTTEELEARLQALEQKQSFDFKMQKNFREFNQKLKGVTLSPSASIEEHKKDTKFEKQSPKHLNKHQSSTNSYNKSHRTNACRPASPKNIQFKDNKESDVKFTCIRTEDMVSSPTHNVLQTITENSKALHRILKKTFTDSNAETTSLESLNSIGRMSRLSKETSPLRRSGTHTGVPLRTGENINDRLTSIQNTIKNIDTLCEEKPYCKEKCQRYIDSLFHNSVYMACKKSSLEELTTSQDRSRSVSKGRQPSIHISNLSISGSVPSIPHSAIYGQQSHSPRNLRRDYSPRRRYSAEREENNSRLI